MKYLEFETISKKLIEEAASTHDLPIELIGAIILQESQGNTWASRYENNFYQKYVATKQRDDLIGYVPKTISLSTEKLHRATSFGIMQVMGQTARENGYVEESLLRLCVPSIGIKYGCLYLIKCLAGRTLEDALLKWNGGGNINYPYEVIARIDSGEYGKLLTGD